MRLNRSTLCVLATLFFTAAIPGFSQVVPSASEAGQPLVIGAGFSNYNDDFGADRREDGGTIWADWNFRRLPFGVKGIGLEIEARDISLNPPAGLPTMRYDTAGGGLIYQIPHFRTRTIHPYAKGLIGFGSIDFPAFGSYSHDTRSFFAFAGGADFHA